MPTTGLAISRRAAAGLAAAVSFLIAATLGGLLEHRQAIAAGDWSLHTVEVLQQAKLVLARLTDAETGQRGFLLTGIDVLAGAFAALGFGTVGFASTGAKARPAVEAGDGVPAIALTGFVGKEDVDAASSAGFTAHVAKPVDPDSLIGKIRQVVRDDGRPTTAGV